MGVSLTAAWQDRTKNFQVDKNVQLSIRGLRSVECALMRNNAIFPFLHFY